MSILVCYIDSDFNEVGAAALVSLLPNVVYISDTLDCASKPHQIEAHITAYVPNVKELTTVILFGNHWILSLKDAAVAHQSITFYVLDCYNTRIEGFDLTPPPNCNFVFTNPQRYPMGIGSTVVKLVDGGILFNGFVKMHRRLMDIIDGRSDFRIRDRFYRGIRVHPAFTSHTSNFERIRAVLSGRVSLRDVELLGRIWIECENTAPCPIANSTDEGAD